jgi:hypothetical protein
VLHHLGERWLKLPFPLDAVRNSSREPPGREAQAAEVISDELVL